MKLMLKYTFTKAILGSVRILLQEFFKIYFLGKYSYESDLFGKYREKQTFFCSG